MQAFDVSKSVKDVQSRRAKWLPSPWHGSLLTLLIICLAIAITALVLQQTQTHSTLTTYDETGIKELLGATSVNNGELIASSFATSGTLPFGVADESGISANFTVNQGALVTATVITNSLTLTSDNASAMFSMTDDYSLISSDKPLYLDTVLQFQNLSTAERDANLLPTPGSVIYNSSTESLNLYSSSWQPFGTVNGTAGQIDVTSGIISLIATGVTPGTYSSPELTVDEFGRATAVASNILSPFPISRTVYVDKAGSDITGNGTSRLPFLTINKALTTVMSGTSAANQTVISVGGGIFTENNSAGPFAITSSGISLVGYSSRGTLVQPSTPANALYSGSVNFTCLNMSFTSTASTATCFSWSGVGYQLYFNNSLFRFYQSALTLTGSGPVLPTCLVDACVFAACGTTITTNNCNLLFNDSQLRGTLGTTPSASFNGIRATGVSTVVYISGASLVYCGFGLYAETNTQAVVNATNFIFSNQCVLADSEANVTINASTFTQLDDVAGFGPQQAVHALDSSTVVSITGCSFDGRNLLGQIKGIGVIIEEAATGVMQTCNITHCAIGLQVGKDDNSDTSSTACIITSSTFTLNTESIHLHGLDPGNAPALTGSTLSIDDLSTIILDTKTNVKLFTSNTSSSSSFLNIGTLENADTSLVTIATKETNAPTLDYQTSLYGAESLCFVNPDAVSASSSTIAMLNASNNVLAGTTSNEASLRLNTRNGGQTRGWRIYKDQPSAKLQIAFTNEIAGIGLQSETTYFQIDGTNNLVSLPTNAGALTFGASNDTSLARASAGVLTTPGNVIVAGLTASRALTTNASKQLTSSTTTDAELAFVNGVTSAIQTQLDAKLPLTAGAGFPLTGALTVINGTGAAPGLNFTGSANTGISLFGGALQLSTAGVVRESIASSGAVTLSNLSTGVVHAGVAGLLTSSTIATIDIGDAQVTNEKLATASSVNTPLSVVTRDAGGEFQASMIQVSGTTINATDVASKNYVDGKVATGLVYHAEVRLVAVADVPNIATGTLPIIDGVQVVDGDRILLTAQTTGNVAQDNGAWVAHDNPTPWARPADFANATVAGAAYFAVTAGTVYSGSAWVCTTPSITIGAGNLAFAVFSAPTTIAGSNLTTEEGLIFKNTTGTTLNFRSINQGAFALVDTDSTLADAVTIAVDATSANTASKIVARDASNNFAAGTITASLNGVANGNLASTGGTLSGGVTFTTGTFAAGSSALPSVNFTGSTTTGLSCGVADTLSVSVAAAQVGKVDATNWFLNQTAYTAAAGVVHNDITTGRLTSSLIVDADVKSDAAIVDTKLATISTAGKVANTATTATAANTASTIVARDVSNNFSAGTITVATLASATLGRVIIGNSATTSGTGSNQIAIGNAAQAGEGSSIAIGDNAIINTATSGGSIAIGFGSAISAVQNATCVGASTIATVGSSSAFGYQCEANAASAVAIGVTCVVSGTAGIAIGSSSQATATNAIAIGQTAVNVTANSALIGSTSIANLRPNNTATCTLGTAAARFSDAHLSGSLVGSITTSAVNNIVTNAGASTSGNVASFSGTTGKIITDSGTAVLGTPSANSITFVTQTSVATPAAGRKTLYVSTTTGQLSTTDSSANVLSYVSSIATPPQGDEIVVFDGTSGFSIKASSITADTELHGVAAIRTLNTNVIIGFNSGVTGTSQIAIGANALNLNTASGNIAIGPQTLDASTTAANNVCIGVNAGTSVTIGNGNNFYGHSSGLLVTDASTNSAYGHQSLQNDVTGSNNSCIGNQSLRNTTTSDNTGIGAAAGLTNTTGSSNTYLGKSADCSVNSLTNSMALGANSSVGVSNTIVLGNASVTVTRPGATDVQDLGLATTGRFKDAHLSGSIVGSTTTSAVNNLVTNAGASTSGNLASFSGTTGKIITDSTIVSTNVVTNVGASTSGNLTSFSGTTGKIVTDSAIAAANVVTNTGGAVTSGHLVQFSGTGGRLITTAGAALSAYLPLAGGTMTGNVDFGAFTMTAKASQPVVLSKYTQNQQNNGFGATVTETDALPPVSTGSLVYGVSTTVLGTTMRWFNSWLLTFGAATTMTVRLKVDGTTFQTIVIGVGAMVNINVTCNFTLQVRNASQLYSTCEILRSGFTPIVQNQIATVWALTSSHTLSLTSQFNDTNGTFRGDGSCLESVYQS